jgi:pullulanase/glycogen debranching enzyme
MAREASSGPGPSATAPLGATTGPEGVNFSLYSKHATDVELLLFDNVDQPPARVIRIDPTARTYHYWHVFVPGLPGGADLRLSRRGRGRRRPVWRSSMSPCFFINR